MDNNANSSATWRTIDRIFHLADNKTTVKREVLAGITTFVSMAYILFVNPSILGQAGMNKGAVFTATALSAIIGCLLMGVLANYPIAIAPGLGDNAFFTFSVVLAMGISWQKAMAGVFVASIIFVVLSLMKIREFVIDAIPRDLKLAMAAGIGIFIAFIGLQEGGLVGVDKSNLVSLGSLTHPAVWLTIFGIFVIGILMARKVPGSIFIGMVLTTIVGLFTGLIKAPHHFISMAPSLKPTFGVGVTHIGALITDPQLWAVVIVFLLVAFFDTAGTLIGLAQQAGIMKGDKMPRMNRALISDSVSMLAGSIMGTTPTSAYVESSAGIAVGGKTGLTTVVVAVLFVISMLFSPLLTMITDNVTAPALIIVGVLMASSLREINWDKFEVAFPSFLTLIGIPLTYNISYGIAFGFLTYPIMMTAAGKIKQVRPIVWILMVTFIVLLTIMNVLPH